MSQSKLKSVVILLVTLLVGAVLGGLLVAKVARERVQQANAFVTQAGFAHQVGKVLAPESAAQQRAVDEVLQRSGQRVERVFSEAFADLKLIMDDTQNELAPLVSDAQLARLTARREALSARRSQRDPKR